MRALAREPVYYQFFCGELSFCHKLPFARSSLTHWRQRLGEEQRSRPHWGDSQARAPGSEDAMHGENRAKGTRQQSLRRYPSSPPVGRTRARHADRVASLGADSEDRMDPSDRS